MNQRWIIILAISMGIALVSLIVVQVYWVRNAMNLNEGEFNKSVGKALAGISNDINQKITSSYIVDEYGALSDTTKKGYDFAVEIHSNNLKTSIKGYKQTTVDAGGTITAKHSYYSQRTEFADGSQAVKQRQLMVNRILQRMTHDSWFLLSRIQEKTYRP